MPLFNKGTIDKRFTIKIFTTDFDVLDDSLFPQPVQGAVADVEHSFQISVIIVDEVVFYHLFHIAENHLQHI